MNGDQVMHWLRCRLRNYVIEFVLGQVGSRMLSKVTRLI